MRKYIIVITAIVTSLLTIAALGVVNYYTSFAYYLPHRPAMIELAPNDILVDVHPQVIGVPAGANKTFTVNVTLPPAQ